MKLDTIAPQPGRTYLTRDGRRVRIFAVGLNCISNSRDGVHRNDGIKYENGRSVVGQVEGEWDVDRWFPDGRYAAGRYSWDIVRELPTPIENDGGCYNSSTHGRIPLSGRGRQLLAAERDAAQGAIMGSNFGANDKALSKARAEIAKYMGDIEVMNNILRDANTRLDTELRRAKGADKTAHCIIIIDESALIAAELRVYCKENTVINQKKADPTLIPDSVKSRSELLAGATRELCEAQRALEMLLSADQTPPKTTYIMDGGVMGSAIAPLILEQWKALAKKAMARAKARVTKAEKAVSELLA